MIKLLVVEDDPTLLYIVQSSLQDMIGGYEVFTATDGAEGLKAWKEHRPDVIISDIDMPTMTGIEMVKRIRETDGDTPILFASGMTSPSAVVDGYSIGVDNYVKKPYIPEELNAHIRAVLKMKSGAKTRNESECYQMGMYLLDACHATLRNDKTGEVRVLTVREAGILQTFCENKDAVVSRAAILSRFWETEDNDFFVSRSLDVFMTKLRKYLKDDPRIVIKTIKKVGYCYSVAD